MLPTHVPIGGNHFLLGHAEIVRNFFDWVRDLMHKYGGKDVYFNDGTVVKGAFEGFLGAGLERLNTWHVRCCYIPI